MLATPSNYIGGCVTGDLYPGYGPVLIMLEFDVDSMVNGHGLTTV